MKKPMLALIALGCLAMAGAEAAIPKNSSQGASTTLSSTRELLSLSFMERISRLQAQGPQGYRNLVKIMFDEKSKMDVRWKAVTAVGRIGGVEAKPEIERALRHPEWFMRNAGLLAMRGVDRKESANWARRLLADKALVVRSAAVDMISEMNDRQSAALLWEKLNAPENFKNGHSLYIRRRIVETLAQLDVGAGREAKYIAVLNDKDVSLHEPAVRALERITKTTQGAADAGTAERRAQWLEWWKNNG